MNKDKVQRLFNSSSASLYELEAEIRLTHNTPVDNILRNEFILINIPNKYIRKTEYFRKEYRLSEYINDSRVVDNIAYSLQISDLHNYFINRFNLFGIIKNLYLKNAIINLFSIEEAILYSAITTLNKFCWQNNKVCKKNNSCEFYVKTRNNLKFNDLVEVYQKRIGFYDQNFIEVLNKLKEIRDCVHIEDVKYSELLASDTYSMTNYNNAITSLHFMKINLPKQIRDFVQKREIGCKS